MTIAAVLPDAVSCSLVSAPRFVADDFSLFLFIVVDHYIIPRVISLFPRRNTAQPYWTNQVSLHSHEARQYKSNCCRLWCITLGCRSLKYFCWYGCRSVGGCSMLWRLRASLGNNYLAGRESRGSIVNYLLISRSTVGSSGVYVLSVLCGCSTGKGFSSIADLNLWFIRLVNFDCVSKSLSGVKGSFEPLPKSSSLMLLRFWETLGGDSFLASRLRCGLRFLVEESIFSLLGS